MMSMVTLRKAAFLSAAGLVLAGCASGPKPLYQWEGYQTQVYQYLKDGAKEEQVLALESGLDKMKAKGGSAPPGYHAQLGMLYLNLGKGDQMVKEFQTEKTLFPEATPYMDFLMRNVKTDKRPDTRAAAKADTTEAKSDATTGSAK
ncbi:hypothetical protein ACUXAV_002148 [Cupriavidus metallidurans]|jgi:hypothetical protein|uniref:Lipoprotein n=2 Tax=Burkholderiaceae TaxID=119060 RepID=Q1LCC9_CUPMC|nr:DUF4810 domain-containing protein [Cupriavidus metallidurans]ABF12197.1 putative lipoprotein [Cupriavidus metallidurans CH34]AVA35690.1 DUF4810 domain-containing protein [Cupriavidus metallidurans]KWW35521.1 hypothetical protein AU374_03588 [Cupriavidus metallidurans]MDE4921660.1 DUF4810 domain-containing protein [Cupriavidus metallidurans]QGS32554.1 DUF4810 domain-containing protein [Cupriavidus metallidurans]